MLKYFSPYANFWKGQILQENVLNYIITAYHDSTGTLVVPDYLQMRRDSSSSREVSELKSYRTRNRYKLLRSQSFYYSLSANYFYFSEIEGILLAVEIAVIF